MVDHLKGSVGPGAGRLPPLTQIPPEVQQVADYESLARARMAVDAWQHVQAGWTSTEACRQAFARWHVRPRVLQPMAGAHTRTCLLDQQFAHPFLLAPVAYQRLAHADGELASAEAAALLGGGYVASTQASVSLEAVAEVSRRGVMAYRQGRMGKGDQEIGGMSWFQLYFQWNQLDTISLIRRAEQAGYAALVLTVDAPVKRRLGFQLPADIAAVNLQGFTEPVDPTPSLVDAPLFGSPLLDQAATWQDLRWLRAQTALPLWVKGILTPEDAREAIACGVDGLIVSHHGGRVLDDLPPPLAMLPAVVAEARAAAPSGRRPVPVLMDGGIRRGADAFKALCLGASAVLIGRPYVHGLAAAGALGVAHVIHLLRAELELTMTVAGCRTLDELSPDCLQPAA